MNDIQQLCKGCNYAGLTLLRDFGLQPPSNYYPSATEKKESHHPLILGQCRNCGLLQLINPMSPEMVKPHYKWILYNEPEAHLDDFVSRLQELPGISRKAVIHGVTYKDDTTLNRLAHQGFTSSYRYDAQKDLGINDVFASIETIQSKLDLEKARHLLQSHGSADIIIARHVLEHAHDPISFITCLGRMLRPKGYLVFELPDCTKFINGCDYSFIWEEHIIYFSPYTITVFVEHNGFMIHELISYNYALEDSIIAILQLQPLSGAQGIHPSKRKLDKEFVHSRNFALHFEELHLQYNDKLKELHNKGKRIALFGAGHLAAKFLNLFGLKEYVQCVVDDNANKQGLTMPGSRVPIVGSSLLLNDGIDICLLSLNPASEQNVLSKYHAFKERGGQFYSIFPLSQIAFL